MDWSKIEQEVQYQTQALVQHYSHQRRPLSSFSDENIRRDKKHSVRQSKIVESVFNESPPDKIDINELQTSISNQQAKLVALEKIVNAHRDDLGVSQRSIFEKVDQLEDSILSIKSRPIPGSQSLDFEVPLKTLASKVSTLQDSIDRINQDYASKEDVGRLFESTMDGEKSTEALVSHAASASQQSLLHISTIIHALGRLSGSHSPTSMNGHALPAPG